MSSPVDSDNDTSSSPQHSSVHDGDVRVTSPTRINNNKSSKHNVPVHGLLTARTAAGATLLARVVLPTPHLLASFVQTFTQSLILFLGQGIRNLNKEAKKKQSIAATPSSSKTGGKNASSKAPAAPHDNFAPAPPLDDETDSLQSVNIMITIIRYNQNGNRDMGVLWIRPAEVKPMCRMLPSAYLPVVFSRDDEFPKPNADPSIIVNAFKFLNILKIATKFKSVKQRRMFGISFCSEHYDVIFPEYRTDDARITASDSNGLRPVPEKSRKKKKKNMLDDEADEIEGDAVSLSSEDDSDGELTVRFDKRSKTHDNNENSETTHRTEMPVTIDDESRLLESKNLRAAVHKAANVHARMYGGSNGSAAQKPNPLNDIKQQQNEKKRKRDAILATGVVASERQLLAPLASMQPLRVMPNLVQRIECCNPGVDFCITESIPNVLFTQLDEFLLRPTEHVALGFSCKVLHDMVQTWLQAEDNAKLLLSVTHRLSPPTEDDVQCHRIVKFSVHGQCKQVFETIISKKNHPWMWSEIYECAMYDAKLRGDNRAAAAASSDDDDEMISLDANGNILASPTAANNDRAETLPTPTRNYILLALSELLIILREVLRCTDDASFTIMYPRKNQFDIRYTVAPVTLGDKASGGGGEKNSKGASAASVTPSRCWKLKLIGEMIPADDMSSEELTEMLGGNSSTASALAGMSFHQNTRQSTGDDNNDDVGENGDLVEDVGYTNFVQQIDLDEAGDVREDSRKAAEWEL